jgi:pilus assembly protein TadC
MKTYIKSLISGATMLALGVHFIEDVSLISIGRWLPLPWWAAYAIGIGFSWVMLAGIINRIEQRKERMATL